MYNEMQAYLMFTRDPTFFTADMVGMTQDRLADAAGAAFWPACRLAGCGMCWPVIRLRRSAQ